VFEELMPILTERVLVVTLSRVSEDEICINVIPKPLKSEQQDNNAALTTPLSVTGTPKELDEQLPRQLVEFVETHLGLSSTLKSAKEQMEAAAKAAREAARKPTNSKSQSSKNATPSTAKVQTECVTKESSDDSESTPEHTQPSTAGAGGSLGASTGSLFDLEPKSDN
jgi:PRTRC genetic system protein E